MLKKPVTTLTRVKLMELKITRMLEEIPVDDLSVDNQHWVDMARERFARAFFALHRALVKPGQTG